MAKLFDIQNRQIILNPNVLKLGDFKTIWDRDDSEEKDLAVKEITYIVFKNSFNSPFYEMADKDKEKYILKEIFGGTTKWRPDALVKKAEATFLQLQETDSTRLLKSARSAANKIAEYFESVDFTETDNYGKPKYSVRDLVSSLKEAGNLVNSISKLQKQVEKERTEAASIRGGLEIGPFET